MSIAPISRVPAFPCLANPYQAKAWSELKASLFPGNPDGFPDLAAHVSLALHLYLRRYHQSDIAAAVAFLQAHNTLAGCPTFAFDRRDETDCQRILERHRERVVETLDAGYDVTI